ncbi:MAG: FAD:protein FMN transferase [Gammaproteobacteria bacterium]|nr:MAG: FAD:protein FMN transferase [Gammaproteobacteria bacterium]
MGTTYHVKWVPVSGVDDQALADAVFEALREVDDLMSTYASESDVSRLNRAPLGQWVPVSDKTLDVARLSRHLWEKTGGAFDPTVGKLVNVWGFGPDKSRVGQVPDEALIEALKNDLGYDKLRIRDKPPALARDTELYLDFSAVAKGYGVDRAAEVLERHGVHNYLVEVGGEVRVKGMKAKGKPWQLAIEAPVEQGRVPRRIVGLTDAAVATSGSYRNFFDKDGKRYSHTIDPRSGRPVEHTLASVTVVSSSVAFADGLATAMMVLGPEQGYDLAVKEGWAVYFIISGPDGFVDLSTPVFDRVAKTGVYP